MNNVSEKQAARAGQVQSPARLDETFRRTWRSYRRTFKRCRKKLSGTTVHQWRVETRRLVALVELFNPLLGGEAADEIFRLCKRSFKASGQLRDTQVMLRDVARQLRRFPEAKGFQKDLRCREKNLEKLLARKIQPRRLKPLKRRMDAFRKQLRAAGKQAGWRRRASLRLRQSVDEAFAAVVARRRAITPGKPRAIHRTRVAFKKFRYMIEQLQPLLPALPGDRRGKLREYQKLMGDIQDCKTLLATLNDFARREKSSARALRAFRLAVQRDHARLVARYLRRADELFSFWQPLP
jgi:CHAD domain-containing protein